MATELHTYSGRIAKIKGPARSGKTEILVQRCVYLLQKGVDPTTILVVVASDFAREAFESRLTKAAKLKGCEDRAANIKVSRALDVCVEILNEPLAHQLTGRTARILSKTEYTLFLEDVKPLGIKNQRLHNMLLFFYNQWSSGKDEKSWMEKGEETFVVGHMRKVLNHYGAMLRYEAPYLCNKLLASDEGMPLVGRYDYVFCDDFQNLSHAEQSSMCMCAKKQIMICGNSLQTTKVNTAYPSADGFDKFEKLRHGVEVFDLDTAYGTETALDINSQIVEGKDGLKNAVSNNGKTQFLTWETPNQELLGISAIIKNIHETSDTQLSDICIAVPSKKWGIVFEKALTNEGIETCPSGLGFTVGGDPRTEGHHDLLTALAKLSLAACPEDGIAWRTWTGFDNALCNSDIWIDIQAIADSNHINLYEALKIAGTGEKPVTRQETIRKAWQDGQNVISQLRDFKGKKLALALGLDKFKETAPVVGNLAGNESAFDLHVMINKHLASPSFGSGNQVHMALYENMCGLSYKVVIVPSMVNGLMPSRDAFDEIAMADKKDKVMEEDRLRLYSALTKASDRLIISTFSETDLEIAERTKMKVNRITSKCGNRIALLAMSTFLSKNQYVPQKFEDGSELIAKMLV